MYYHLFLIRRDGKKVVSVDNQELEPLKEIVRQYCIKGAIIINDIVFYPSNISKFSIIESEYTLKESRLAFEERNKSHIKRDDIYILLKMEGSRDIKHELCKEFYKPQTDKINSDHDISNSPNFNNKNVFIVHGRNLKYREKVSTFVQDLGLNPIILSEQPNNGKTLIEKFEKWMNNVCYCIVIYTPDDLGKLNNKRSKLDPRPRQNVILEHGYAMAKLGRERVCVLHLKEMKKPSDIDGIVYIPFDKKEKWQENIKKELTELKIL